MVLCDNCGFEKDGVLCAEAPACTERREQGEASPAGPHARCSCCNAWWGDGPCVCVDSREYLADGFYCTAHERTVRL